MVAVRFVEVQSFAPRGFVPVREVRPKAWEVISLRPEMVIYDVQNDRQPCGMTRVDQLLQALWAAVRILNGERVHAVVSPIAGPGKLRHRHQFDRGNAEAGKRAQVWNHASECATLAESSNVQFVNDVIFDRQS